MLKKKMYEIKESEKTRTLLLELTDTENESKGSFYLAITCEKTGNSVRIAEIKEITDIMGYLYNNRIGRLKNIRDEDVDNIIKKIYMFLDSDIDYDMIYDNKKQNKEIEFEEACKIIAKMAEYGYLEEFIYHLCRTKKGKKFWDENKFEILKEMAKYLDAGTYKKVIEEIFEHEKNKYAYIDETMPKKSIYSSSQYNYDRSKDTISNFMRRKGKQ